MTTRGIPEHVAACERAAWKHRIISRDLETAERRWMRALDEWLAANKALSKVMGALDIAEGEMEQLAKGAPRVSALAARSLDRRAPTSEASIFERSFWNSAAASSDAAP